MRSQCLPTTNTTPINTNRHRRIPLYWLTQVAHRHRRIPHPHRILVEQEGSF